MFMGTVKFADRGEILRPPENSVPQTIVLRFQEIEGILCTKQRSNVIVSIYRIFRKYGGMPDARRLRPKFR
jgi:hypothetical protein